MEKKQTVTGDKGVKQTQPLIATKGTGLITAKLRQKLIEEVLHNAEKPLKETINPPGTELKL